MKEGSFRSTSQLSGAFVWMIIAGLLVSCAGAGGEAGRQHTEGKSLPRPPVLLIHDLAVDPAEVTVDELGPNFVRGEALTSEQLEQGRAVSRALSEELVTQLAERGITARRADGSTNVPMHALVAKGQFVSIKEGDQMARVVVGFGAGGASLQAYVRVYQQTATGLRPIVSDAKGETHGRKLPGVGPAGAVAAGTGMIVGLVVASAVTTGSELKGEMATHVKNLAEEYADRAEKFYRRQGWL